MTLETVLLLAWLISVSNAHGLDPALVKAVADVESGVSEGFKTGPLNRRKTLWAPMGISTKCKVPGTRNAYRNIEIGVKALVKHGARTDPKRALKKYNAEFTQSYYAAVMKKCRQYRKEGLR